MFYKKYTQSLKGLKTPCLLFSLLVVAIKADAQQVFSSNTYPLTEFIQPLEIKPPALAGSFGELRSNHFHSGVDFRTNQRTGFPVYATADGYISRLRVQNSGFGLALYINHPNGYTSVYGHLQTPVGAILDYVKATHYKEKAYEIEMFPKPDELPVTKGKLIGLSGNTGSSEGPHLHFEIRDSKTEFVINPIFFGFDKNIKDNKIFLR